MFRSTTPRGKRQIATRALGALSGAGYVYFIAAHLDRSMLVKIGWATNPRSRLVTLQTGSPVTLMLLRIVAGVPPDETRLHYKYRALRARGEWFALKDPLHEYILSLDEEPVLRMMGKTKELDTLLAHRRGEEKRARSGRYVDPPPGAWENADFSDLLKPRS